MAVYLSKKRVYSHLDPVGGPILASREARRMKRWLAWCRVIGETVMFLTFTYDPEPYGDYESESTHKAVWEAARKDKHVSVAMDRLSESLGYSLKGRWRVKAEFQRSGMLHFHMLVRLPAGHHSIDWQLIRDAWGHGRIDVRRVGFRRSKTEVKAARIAEYIAKYNAKAGCGYPAFLYAMKRRSVKIWGTSPGFFAGLDAWERDNAAVTVAAEDIDRGDHVGDMRTYGEAVRARTRAGEYDPDETIGEAIYRADRTVIARDENGDSVECEADFGSVCMALALRRIKRSEADWGWTRWETDLETVKVAMREAIIAEREVESYDHWRFGTSSAGAAVAAAGGSAAPADVFLLEYQDRRESVPVRVPDNASRSEKARYRRDLKAWNERRRWAVRWDEWVDRVRGPEFEVSEASEVGLPRVQTPDDGIPF